MLRELKIARGTQGRGPRELGARPEKHAVVIICRRPTMPLSKRRQAQTAQRRPASRPEDAKECVVGVVDACVWLLCGFVCGFVLRIRSDRCSCNMQHASTALGIVIYTMLSPSHTPNRPS